MVLLFGETFSLVNKGEQKILSYEFWDHIETFSQRFNKFGCNFRVTGDQIVPSGLIVILKYFQSLHRMFTLKFRIKYFKFILSGCKRYTDSVKLFIQSLMFYVVPTRVSDLQINFLI